MIASKTTLHLFLTLYQDVRINKLGYCYHVTPCTGNLYVEQADPIVNDQNAVGYLLLLLEYLFYGDYLALHLMENVGSPPWLSDP